MISAFLTGRSSTVTLSPRAIRGPLRRAPSAIAGSGDAPNGESMGNPIVAAARPVTSEDQTCSTLTQRELQTVAEAVNAL